MKNKFTHIHASGNPQMVDVSEQAVVFLGKEIMSQLQDDELITKKGPVFQTAIIAGVMGANKTSELIPFCHPLGLEDVQIIITPKKEKVIIDATARVTGKTGVEMEALTAASIAARVRYVQSFIS